MSLIPPIASLQSQHATLLATGIEELYDFLQKTLGPPWEVYAHPFFNGDRPHIVALHPAHGLTFFAVMPWDLRQYRCEHRGRYLRYTLRTDHQIHSVLGPVRQAENYVENLLKFYMRSVPFKLRSTFPRRPPTPRKSLHRLLLGAVQFLVKMPSPVVIWRQSCPWRSAPRFGRCRTTG